MISYRVTSYVLGLSVGLIIFYLIRRGYLHIMHSIWWFIVGIICIILGSFPYLINWIAPIMGIHYPPNVLLISAICFFLLKLINMDIYRSKQEMRIHILAERLAILEEKVSSSQNNQKSSTKTSHDNDAEVD